LKIICITGIDGAGKSTLARSVASELCKKGFQAQYFYGRVIPVLSRLAMNFGRKIFLRKNNIWEDYSGYSRSKQKVMRAPILSWGYAFLILLDYYLVTWIKLLPYCFRKVYVVADRYFYDTVVTDLAAHLGFSSNQVLSAVEMGLRFLPKPQNTILIDIPEEIAFARKNDIPHIDYLRERRAYYLDLCVRPEVTMLYGNNSQDCLLRKTMEIIEKETL